MSTEVLLDSSESDFLISEFARNIGAELPAEWLGRQVSLNVLDDERAQNLFQKSLPPFQEIQLLGYPDQGTVHFHCGINNNLDTVVEGGSCLYKSLKEEFAVQPHLIHSDNIATGLGLVGLEKLDGAIKNLPLKDYLFGIAPQIPGTVLENSVIQKSIDYEVENLSEIAQKIIEKNQPNLKQLHVTFSNGGHVFNEALKRLPEEYRQTIVVITTGTTAIIEDGLACKVYNVIGEEDWPSIKCNGGRGGIEMAKGKATIRVIPQNKTDNLIGGHYFVQPDYQVYVGDIIDSKIKGVYEIY